MKCTRCGQAMADHDQLARCPPTVTAGGNRRVVVRATIDVSLVVDHVHDSGAGLDHARRALVDRFGDDAGHEFALVVVEHCEVPPDA